jgi:CMP-N-acetylneuraminic acid synthetase
LHALEWYEAQHGSIDGLLLLQPTSPLRSRATIARGLALFDPALGRPVIGVSPAPSHPMWTFKLEGDSLVPFVAGDGLQTRSQDLPPAYVVNGAFYLTSPQRLRSEKTFFSKDALALLIPSEQEGLDIDTPQDFALAKYYLESKSQ